MKVLVALLVLVPAGTALSGCGGGWPMSAESRVVASEPEEVTPEERARINRQFRRSRASGK